MKLNEISLIGILGLGKTGVSTFKFLRKIGKATVCYDDKESALETFREQFGSDFIADLSDPRCTDLPIPGATVGCNVAERKIICMLNRVTARRRAVSPARGYSKQPKDFAKRHYQYVPPSHDVMHLIREKSLPIVSDIDLFFNLEKSATFIGVTGTDGKSTTTAMIGHILSEEGRKFLIGGNFGIPVFDLPSHQEGYVLELSSFQLERVQDLSLKVGILLNIAPDHLDWHKTMDNYIRAKRHIFDRMTESSYAVVDVDDEICRKIYEELSVSSPAKIIAISLLSIQESGVSIINGKLYDNILEGKPLCLELDNVDRLSGHCLSNVAAVYAACRILNVSPEDILKGANSYSGLAHRIQFVCESRIKTGSNIQFYNDSKATNCHATARSLSRFKNIYWLAGGVFKESCMDSLPLENVTKAYIFGQDRQKFSETLSERSVPFVLLETLKEAFDCAVVDSMADDIPSELEGENNKVILLAPACASFDQFKNFEERGNYFMTLCMEAKQKIDIRNSSMNMI